MFSQTESERDRKLAEATIEIARRCGLTYYEMATIIKVSPTTAKALFEQRRVPQQERARSRVEANVRINGRADSRADVRLVP